MKNLSQRKKLLLMFFCITVIPICITAIINTLTTISITKDTSEELLENRLSHDIESAQLYLEHSIGSIQKQENQFLVQDGSDLATHKELVDQISESLDEQVTIYSKQEESFSIYLTSIKNSTTGEAITNTELDSSSPAYHAVITDKPYVGNVNILGVTYISAYKPLIDESAERHRDGTHS